MITTLRNRGHQLAEDHKWAQLADAHRLGLESEQLWNLYFAKLPWTRHRQLDRAGRVGPVTVARFQVADHVDALTGLGIEMGR